jgi:hypothetical protein
MKLLKNLRINIERYNFRRKERKAKSHDADKKAKAIIKANLTSERIRKRLWVLKHGPADYGIYTKAEVKGALRALGLHGLVNMYQPNQYVIHITKRPE